MNQKPNPTAITPFSASQPLRGLAAIIPALVLLGTLAVLLWSMLPVLRPAREVRVAQAVFDLSTPSAQPIAEHGTARNVPTVQAAGWLEPEPYHVACAALADGVVETITVLEGEYVEQGSVVARLVDADAKLALQNAQAQLADKTAQLGLAQAELEAAKRKWDAPVELERAVEAGRAAVAEAKAELEQLPSVIASARATLERLDEEHERIEALSRASASSAFEQVIAKQYAATQRATVESFERREPILQARIARLSADLRAAERDLQLRIEDRRRVDVAQRSATAAHAAVKRAEAQRDIAQLELDRMVIRAPISGYITRRIKSPGDKVVRMADDTHSAHLVHLYDQRKLQVRVDVPLADASHIYDGQPCEVVVEVLPDRVFRGEVLRATHEADLQKNTLQFKVRVIDPAPILRPEMLTRVKFLGSGRGAAASDRDASRVLVPEAAVDRSGEGPRVWIVTQRQAERGTLVPRSVQEIETRDGWVVVKSDAGDLQPGALLALDFESASQGEAVVVHDERSGGDA